MPVCTAQKVDVPVAGALVARGSTLTVGCRYCGAAAAVGRHGLILELLLFKPQSTSISKAHLRSPIRTNSVRHQSHTHLRFSNIFLRSPQLLQRHGAMSRASKLTLGATSLFAVGTIVLVHFQQQAEKNMMHQGVVRDMEQQRVKRERQLDFDMQKQLEAEFKLEQNVHESIEPVGKGLPNR
ncbi:hypothetical protein G7046_g7429 [Stylonectria norvegica]|nr:hypothetical protein G7046_g7429 [Stylonectria norvegica]